MDSIEKLISYYNKSTEEDLNHSIVEQLLQNLDQISSATIYDIADMCYTSTSSISRLIKKLEFANYSDFKSQITYSLRNYTYLNRNMRDMELDEEQDAIPMYFNFLINNINALESDLKYDIVQEINDRMYNAPQVMMFCYPDIGIDSLQKALLVCKKKAYIYNTVQSQIESLDRINEGTVVLAVIPDLVEMSDIRSIIRRAKDRGAYVITICSGKRNEYKKYSDIQFAFEGTKTSMDLYMFMIIVNVLRYDLSNRYVNTYMQDLFD